jgi:PAS domain S-box-containing protein
MSSSRRSQLDNDPEARLAAFVEQASDGIFVADLEGRYTEVNRAGCEMLGYRREEIIGKSITDLIPKEQVERLWQLKERLLKGGIEVSEWSILKKDGSYLPVEVSTKILPDGRWQAFVRDISGRKSAERALRESEVRFRLAAHAAGLGTFEFVFATGRTYLSPRLLEIFGLPGDTEVPHDLGPSQPDWLLGKIHVEDRQRVAEKIEATVEPHGSGEFHDEHRIVRPDGSIRWVAVDGQIFAGGEAPARPLRFAGTVLDITERKRAQEEHQLLAEVGAVLASTLDYEEPLGSFAKLLVREFADYCVVDVLDEYQRLRRVTVAHRDPTKTQLAAALRSIELRRCGKHFVPSVLETRRALLVSPVMQQYLEQVAQGPENLRVLRELAPDSLIALPLEAGGRLLGALILVRTNATRRFGSHHLPFAQELARRAALAVENARLHRTAQQAIKDRDDVLGLVAHDLRNPLAAILMQAERLLHREAMPERRQPIEGIARVARRMNRLIQDLLDVTRIEAGQLSIACLRASAERLVAEAVESQRVLANSASLELGLDVAQELPEVWADRDRMAQVLENLIGNAIKFTRPGGRITVGAAPRRSAVLFWVADTGPGISADDVPHVFDRFWQARQATRVGAGLGLPIAKGLVEAQGGRIWVESDPGRGTTFFFTIPKPPPADEAHEPIQQGP